MWEFIKFGGLVKFGGKYRFEIIYFMRWSLKAVEAILAAAVLGWQMQSQPLEFDAIPDAILSRPYSPNSSQCSALDRIW